MASAAPLFEDWKALLGAEDMKLPDGLVEGTTLGDWQRLLDCLADAPWVLTFNHRGVCASSFAVSEMFDGDAAARTISIELACTAVVVIFVRQSTSIDFDFNLDEIECQQDLNEFLDFVRVVGLATKREVRLLYEGSEYSFGGYLYESDKFYLVGSEHSPRIGLSPRLDESQADERRNWERSRLVVAGAKLRSFRKLEIGLKDLVDGLFPLIDDQTILPAFWSEAALDAWGQLEVDYALAVDAAPSIPDFSYLPVRENVIELENLVVEGKRRLYLLDSPLSRFAMDRPLLTWHEAMERLPIGSTVQGIVTRITPFGFFLDLNLPFAGLLHKPEKSIGVGLQTGQSLTLMVVDFARHTFRLGLPAEHNWRKAKTAEA
jgi:hypothetical protein